MPSLLKTGNVKEERKDDFSYSISEAERDMMDKKNMSLCIQHSIISAAIYSIGFPEQHMCLNLSCLIT